MHFRRHGACISDRIVPLHETPRDAIFLPFLAGTNTTGNTSPFPFLWCQAHLPSFLNFGRLVVIKDSRRRMELGVNFFYR